MSTGAGRSTGFGELKAIVTQSNRRYIVFGEPGNNNNNTQQQQQQQQQQANNKSSQSTNSMKKQQQQQQLKDMNSSLVQFTPYTTTIPTSNDFNPIDPLTQKERQSIHGIPIMRLTDEQIAQHEASGKPLKRFSMVYGFPALLAPSLASQFAGLTLPQPTPGGTIQLYIQSDELSGLLKQYETLYTTITNARNLHPYTHYFGIPLGPTNSFAHDLQAKPPTNTNNNESNNNNNNNNNTKSSSDIQLTAAQMPVTAMASNHNINTTNYILPTKFMQSDTSIQLAKLIMQFYKSCGVDTTNCLSTIPQKHTSYNNNPVGVSVGESLKLAQSELEKKKNNNNNNTKQTAMQQYLGDSDDKDNPADHDPNDYKYWIQHAIMPIPKLHCTLFLCKILSLDELNAVQQLITLHGIQRIIYDAIGGTSVLLRIKGTEVWNKSNDNKTAMHFVAPLAEAGKPGKMTARDHMPVDPTSSASNDNNNGNVEKQQQVCPRLALIVGILSHALLKTGVITPQDIKTQRLGTETGSYCQVKWHMTLLNAKYARTLNPTFLLNVDDCTKNIKQINDFGTHRVPCINLYRMGSSIYNEEQKKKLFNTIVDPKYADFNWLPYRHKIKDHYTIEQSINMP